MQAFQFFMPVRILFGSGRVNEAGKEIKKLGSKAMLVTGKSSMKKLGILDRVVKNLKDSGIDVTVYSEVEPNPVVETVDNGAKIASQKRCDVIIGLGGGSAIDTGKGIAVVAAHGGSVWDFMEAGKKPGEARAATEKTLPIVAIPTTSGTGTETTPYAVVTNRQLKLKDGFGNAWTYPRLSIIDPELMVSMSPALTAQAGLDAFGQALECYTSKFANAASDTLAIEGIRLISENLRIACRDGKNIEARANIAWGTALSGMVIGQVDANLCHAMSHPVSAIYNISHGLAVGLLTPATMEYNLDAVTEKYARVAGIMGEKTDGLSTKESANLAVKAVRKLMKDLGFPGGLKAAGVKESDIRKLAEDTLIMGALTTNIKEAKLDDLIKIFNEAL